MENSVMLSAVCNEPVSLKVVKEPFYRKGFSPFVHKQTGTWWEYDDDKKGFFDTGIIAQGRDGNDYVITEQDYNTIVERTLSNVNPTLDEQLSSKLPKSTTDWEPWTAEEQAAARERMGITSTLMSFNDQTIPYGAEGLGRIIAGYYKMANYDNPVLVAASIALYGNTALVFGVYRPMANMSMLCIEGTSIKRLFKNNLEEWSFEHFTLY